MANCPTRRRWLSLNQFGVSAWRPVPLRSLGPFGPHVSCYTKRSFCNVSKTVVSGFACRGVYSGAQHHGCSSGALSKRSQRPQLSSAQPLWLPASLDLRPTTGRELRLPTDAAGELRHDEYLLRSASHLLQHATRVCHVSHPGELLGSGSAAARGAGRSRSRSGSWQLTPSMRRESFERRTVTKCFSPISRNKESPS